ncbi:uncharacterized protein BCR38DRAFT_339589 [Pseudomassariella vexata]|uniref:HCP-like protein n=1 Tax=Pseudomassariella vexata TaxID=1141098 RepID=A0A1Y2E413_9PEZI|nr:uncharacterized protein BCR38DRAFT_339589 [Pseudomassariella vexata]ORY66291.1 hypothetical protein BCR38DRAFT_339589 [Pseudomassariella vexata]
MGLREMLKKKDRLDDGYSTDPETVGRLAAPEFTFIRSDTHTQEVIYPPTGPESNTSDDDNNAYLTARDSDSGRPPRRSLDVFKSKPRARGSSVSSVKSESGLGRLSQRLRLSRQPSTSEYVPEDLPQIRLPLDGSGLDKEVAELQWENRATMLAQQSEKKTRSRSASHSPAPQIAKLNLGDDAENGSNDRAAHGGTNSGIVSSQQTDEDIQEAIRLHEEGSLEQSTQLFGRLADPNGANNPLSQVLYGLALRHGWGCIPDPENAVTFLSAAASNAAVVENMALQAGLRKGGAAKGELVLAIFELANCFRHGWGINKDPVAAKQYYETAANLGDTDAMNEVAWCYLEGYGCKKDKFAAARYYRLAEKNGNKTLGNSWYVVIFFRFTTLLSVLLSTVSFPLLCIVAPAIRAAGRRR